MSLNNRLRQRRTYYGHEPVYASVLAAGGNGWEDRRLEPTQSAYDAFERFLDRTAGPNEKPSHALGLGCGGGQTSIALAAREFQVTAVDFSESAIALAAQNAADAGFELDLHVGDILDPAEWANARYSLIVDHHVLHCLIDKSDRAKMLRVVARALAPDGIFLSETMTADGDFDASRLRADPENRVCVNRTRYWAYAAEVEQEFSRAGLRIQRRELRAQEGGEGVLLSLVATRAS